MASSRIRGVILDVDGTLVDSNDAHARAWVDAFAEFGFDVPFERVRAAHRDGRRQAAAGGDRRRGGQPAGRSAIAERRGEIFKERYLRDGQARSRGTRELLTRMRDEGLELAVGTSAQKEELEPLLEIAGVADLIDSKTSSDDAESSKPDPDIIQAALKRLQPARRRRC